MIFTLKLRIDTFCVVLTILFMILFIYAQGNEEEELPEVLMGCCSCYHVDMSTGVKL